MSIHDVSLAVRARMTVYPADPRGDHVGHVLRADGTLPLRDSRCRRVAPGVYELLCPPLKLADGGGDGAPARAVLRDLRAGVRDDPQPEH